MITTVTTVTTVTTIAALGLAGAISIGASSSGFSLRIAKFVSVGILPLVMVFAVIVTMKIVEVLA